MATAPIAPPQVPVTLPEDIDIVQLVRETGDMIRRGEDPPREYMAAVLAAARSRATAAAQATKTRSKAATTTRSPEELRNLLLQSIAAKKGSTPPAGGASDPT